MKLKEFIRILKTYNKTYYTKREIGLIIEENGVRLDKNIKQLINLGLLEEIAKNIYVVFTSYYDVIEVASQLYLPNYLSFESALARYDVLNQIPYTITFATIKSPKNITVAKRQVEFIQIPKNLFWGYVVSGNIYIAGPEKAFLDLIYIASVKNYQIDMDEINLKKLSRKVLLEYSKKFPIKIQKEFVI